MPYIFINLLLAYGLLSTLVVGQQCNKRFSFGTMLGEYSSLTLGSYDQMIVSESDGMIVSVQLGDLLYGSPTGTPTCVTPVPKDGMILLQIQSSTVYSYGVSEGLGCLTYFSAMVNNSICTSGEINSTATTLTMQNATEDYSVVMTGVYSNTTCVYGLEFCITKLVHLKLGSGAEEVAHTNRGKSMLYPGASVNVSWFSLKYFTTIVWGIEVSYGDTNKTTYGMMDPGPGIQFTDFLVKDPSRAFSIANIQCVYANDPPLSLSQIAYMMGVFGDSQITTYIGRWNYGAATLSTVNLPMGLVGIYTAYGEKLLDALEFSNAI